MNSNRPILMDCTLRDGSYEIDFQFNYEDTYKISKALSECNIKYIEVGHGIGLGASDKGFGDGSFFDLFTKSDNSVVLMLGINYNGCTIYHHFDQKLSAKGRFLKKFTAKVKLDDKTFSLNYDSYVKDKNFYNSKTNCLARFDSALSSLKIHERLNFGNSSIVKIETNFFFNYYKAALNVNQDYFLLSTKNQWEEYYLRNNSKLMDNDLDNEMVKKLKIESESGSN
tara:strand:+ start:7218 stop:7895 length:678 start_codon:yes stop_codon:yes gene_type:complete